MHFLFREVIGEVIGLVRGGGDSQHEFFRAYFFQGEISCTNCRVLLKQERTEDRKSILFREVRKIGREFYCTVKEYFIRKCTHIEF